jgi:hypothetical protein
MQHFSASLANVTLQLTVTQQNGDLLITLTGGDVPHYGVVTTISPQTTAQTIALPSRPGHHHQEGQLTEKLAQLIQPVLPGNAFIVCGVHINAIEPAEMRAIFKLTEQLGTTLSQWLQAQSFVIKAEHFKS